MGTRSHLMLNMACGGTRWPGFENSDINHETGTVYVDLEDRPLPYESGCADLIMHSHGLWMTKDGVTPSHPDLPALLAEWHRILRPGGWLRLDDNPFRCYDDREALPAEPIPHEGYVPFPADQRVPRADLKAMLRSAGFSDVYEVNPDATGISADDETADAIVGNHGSHRSFAIEARK